MRTRHRSIVGLAVAALTVSLLAVGGSTSPATATPPRPRWSRGQ